MSESEESEESEGTLNDGVMGLQEENEENGRRE